MLFSQLRAIASMPHKLALLQLQRLLRSQTQLLYAAALLESGAAEALRDWRSQDELIAALGSKRPDYLGHVLRLGVSLGALESRGGRFRAKSRLLRAVTAPGGTAIGFLLREFSHYHGALFRELPEQIAGAPAPDYLARYGDLVAGASRIIEPFMEAFIDRIAGGDNPLRILEIGCGSGVYLQRYASCGAQHHGIAIDFDPAVAQQARDNVKAWGLAGRFEVLHLDIRSPAPELKGPFDLITSFQNVYYFTDEERRELFSSIRQRLASGGTFALVSAMSGKGFIFRYYDVVLNGTAGCHSLPTLAAVLSDLHEAGFRDVERVRMLSGPGALGLLARG